jgi:Family of unknown function (DUF6527)
MKLTELSPEWITSNMFVFKCPHCQSVLLSVKNVVCTFHEEQQWFEAKYGQEWPMIIVPCKEDSAWTFSNSDFNTISVTPSLDASKSGHWHGFVTNGEIR